MPEDYERRMATMEAELRNVNLVVIEFRDYMRASLSERSTNHSELIQRLSVIETKQDQSKEYQDNCEKDRKALENSVTALQLAEGTKAGKASVWAAVIAVLISIITPAVIKRLFP